MRLPNGEVIMHGPAPYDPAKAREYYLRTRQLKGRRKGQVAPVAATRAQAKQQIGARIKGLEIKLLNLESLIQRKEAVLKRDHQINKKPKTISKSKAANQSKEYRQKHKAQLAAKAKAAAKKSGGKGHGGTGTPGKAGAAVPDSQKSIKDLKMLATRVRGQLQAAKAKLSAL